MKYFERDVISAYRYNEDNIQELLCHMHDDLETLKKNGQIIEPGSIERIESALKELQTKTTKLDEGLKSNKELIEYVHTQLALHIGTQAGINEKFDARITALENRPVAPPPSLPLPPATEDCWTSGKVSANGFRFIKSWEAFSSKPYTDSLGARTIGYGITEKWDKADFDRLNNGGLGCSEEQASRVMYERVNSEFGAKILSAVKSLGCTKQSQFDALVSLAFNKGGGRVTEDNALTRIIKANPNDREAISKVWKEFEVRPGTPANEGLKNRRLAEIEVYFGNYGNRKIMKYPYGSGYVEENGGNGWLPGACNGTSPQPPITNGNGKTILVDAGHGLVGDTSGHPGEKQKTREVVSALIPKLQRAGYNVVNCTVDTANGESDQLKKIVAKANQYPQAELLISVHFNGYDTHAYGTETFTYDNAGAKANKYSQNILDSVCAKLGTTKRGAKKANFYILRETICPAVLLECLFLDNPSDAGKYNADKIAEAIVEGINKGA